MYYVLRTVYCVLSSSFLFLLAAHGEGAPSFDVQKKETASALMTTAVVYAVFFAMSLMGVMYNRKG